MPGGFVHSIKVPRLYKSAAKVVQEVRENGGSLKSLIYQQRHPNTSALYSLCLNTLQKEEQLNRLLIETGILTKESRLNPWLAKIFITELLWGKKAINTECKPAQSILKYKTELLEKLNCSSAIKALEPPIKTVRKPRYARVNTLLLPLNEAISNFVEEGWSLQSRCSNYAAHLTAVKNLTEPNFIQDFHIPELLIFPPNTTFHDHAGYQNGEIVLQDKASCFPAYLLNPEPGSVVLDMCAAPGMKSSHLAALLNNQGKVYAVEIDERRYTTLCEQVKITSASCVETLNKDALTLETEDYSNVDYILVDPTCSGSGMLDRQLVHGKEECPPHRLKQLQAFQVFLLRHALLNFPNVKRVVYSTCSINPEENEQVVDEILGNIEDAYKLVSVKNKFKNDWKNYSSLEYNCSDNCLYANSEQDLCNGFFVAVFERDFDVPLPEYKRRGGRVNKEQSQLKENGNPNDEKTGSARKRKKRGQRKSLNKSQNSIMNISSDSITIIDEPPNEDDSIKVYDGDETVGNDDDKNEDHDVSQTNGDVEENEDSSPAKKIGKKRNRKSKKLSNTPKKRKD
ncbi:nop2/Sun-like domain containing protein 5 [Lasioglossum baleicum]|uniref:nop2/Sun-like domain containing protein 5 n=1 Tax=Lasioglossum baleicum TaxID=434251 RepID=UPI003FCC664B